MGQQVVDPHRPVALEAVVGRHGAEVALQPDQGLVELVDQVGLDGVLDDGVAGDQFVTRVVPRWRSTVSFEDRRSPVTDLQPVRQCSVLGDGAALGPRARKVSDGKHGPCQAPSSLYPPL